MVGRYALWLCSLASKQLTWTFDRVTSDFMFWCAHRYAARSLVASPYRQAPVFAYYWNYGPPIDYMNNNQACHFHACHSVEIPYLWRSQQHATRVPFTLEQSTLAQTLQNEFAYFATNNKASWPGLSTQLTPVKVFDLQTTVASDWQTGLCDMWDTLGYTN